ncbi:MAG TPA: DUF1839 family protein [Solirubrobacterales bacterium]|nr:DUF1839 family protein [Solirubrobacterales bacterium]
MAMTPAGAVSLLDLDPATYERHFLHGSDRDYAETNCYADILIEFVHAIGAEPLAMMGCVLPVDFEGDQWTFFKPRPEDVEALYGIDIHEMQPYRPLPDQIADQIEAGRTLVVELDSFHLPDTAATSYGTAHVKSSVIPEAIDRQAETLRYFHGEGYFELGGEDYRGIFRLGREYSDDVLPPYTELLRLDAGRRLEGEELRAAAREMLRAQVARRPSDNPFERFAAALAAELPNLLAGDAQRYHDYAFATVRMVGSAFEVGASHVEWVLGDAGATAAERMREIVAGSKTLSFKLARRREFDPAPAVEALASAWSAGFAELDRALG